MENDSNSMKVVSMPVGTKFSKIKRRVTFQGGNTTVERIQSTKDLLETPELIEKMEAEPQGPTSQSKEE